MPNPTVAIFRKRLLSYTETFIADQGQMLPHYRPLYCGYESDASGIDLIDGSERLLLSEHCRMLPLVKLMFRQGFGAGRWVEALRRESPALVHAHFFNDGVDAVNLARRLQIPSITTLHGHDITKHDNAAGARRLFDRVDRIIAVSGFIADQALARGCPEAKLVQHYIGIDLQRFSQPKRESATPTLLFVGRLVEKKGCTYLLQALARLQPRFPELRLTVVGDGELKPALQREAAQRRVAVDFVGSEDAAGIRQRLAECWLFAAPSVTAANGDMEGLGMVFLEAQALQTPVVSFRSGGVVEAVADEVSGLLCAEKDVDALARNIAALLENDTLRHNMGREGRRRAEQLFDVRKQCAKLEQIYAKLR